MGARARQGPHQVAQKSTSTGVSDFKTSWSKFASVTSTIPLPAMFVSPGCHFALSTDAPSSCLAGPGDLYRMSACPRGADLLSHFPLMPGNGGKSQERPAVIAAISRRGQGTLD